MHLYPELCDVRPAQTPLAWLFCHFTQHTFTVAEFVRLLATYCILDLLAFIQHTGMKQHTFTLTLMLVSLRDGAENLTC